MKGRKRFKKWGCFLKKAKEIQEIENSLIEELDLEKVSYYDLPVKDTGELINMVDYNNVVIACQPSYVKTIVWVYDYKRQNYYYVDEWGKEYQLIKNLTIKKYKIFVYEGEEFIQTIT